MNKTKHQAQNDMLIALYDAIAEDPSSHAQSTSHHELIDVMASVLAVQSEHGRTDKQKRSTRNYVMDPASIEVPRRSRKRKTDRLDAKKLLRLLLRAELWGERGAFSSVCIPSEEQEAALRTHRERERLVKERTGHRSRMKSLSVLHGVEVKNPETVPIDALRTWDGKPLNRKPNRAAHLRRRQRKGFEVLKSFGRDVQ